jgi:hypothetical protein
MSDDESMPTNFYPKSRFFPAVSSPLGLSFEDQIASSDEEDWGARNEQYGQQPYSFRDFNNKPLEPQVRVQKPESTPKFSGAEMIC